MSKTLKIYVGLLILLFVGIIAIEFSTPAPINWQKTYNETQKIPYGTFVFYEELTNLFPESKVQEIKVTPYEYFDDYYNWEDSTYLTTGTYIVVDEYPDLDNTSAQELLDFASHGNDIFISSNYFPDRLLDSLGFDTKNEFTFKGKAEFTFTNPVFKSDSISVEKGLNNIYFSKIDTLNTTVLGHQKFDDATYTNFIEVPWGSGYFYLHVQPVVFTNYHLLKKDNRKYASSVLSYLSDDTLYFDSRNKFRKELGSSPMRFVLSRPALRWAWYIALLTTILFMIFNAKRRQRIVNVKEPLKNTTVDFTKTIGNLYYETKDHDNLIEKKITYFLEYIRRVYYLDTQILDDKFVKNLSLKSGKDKEYIKKLINQIVYLKAKSNCNEANLLQLNKAIEDFYTT
ncbi:DUF4350 domain-containing protein [Psychroserpens burtonensis]|uniref:DUF4350 domain-containing protein n=1 Tax=Psychroserpens burtonensis TaxID=49278 RepID=A0A5C7BFG0_9FLAO|nr:DUF4350 domain-containing protein [Psychroserpens burtonensis]TXE19925.1 DUF4350 domain-containing protein [Psychroserpens burtonensis]